MSVRTLFVCLLLSLGTAAGQSSSQRYEGKLISASSTDTLWVELYEHPGHTLADRVPVSRDGAFQVNANSSQLYEVRVVTMRGERVSSEHTHFRHGHPVEIRLPSSDTDRPKPGGPVSALRLAHKPPKSARRLVAKANSLAENGDLAGSVLRLQDALEADPDWFEAWNNLGARRLTLGQPNEAVEAFRQALRIDPNSARVMSNMGLAFLFLRRAAEAEDLARKALQFEPDSGSANYVAGLAMLQQNKRPKEAIESLHAAARVVPRALLASAEWYCRQEQLAACEADLRTFLKTPRGPNHEKAEKWLSLLKQGR